MGRIPDATINEIRSRVDIVDLVGRYVQLKKAGRNFKGLCPFHDEKTPSFNVHPERQIFHCFGCGEGGDVVGFLMRFENLSFPEAVRTLAGECGVEVPEEPGTAGARGLSERIFQANEVAQRCYVDALSSAAGEAARAYLARRGMGADEIREFGVGFAPDAWDTVERALGRAKIDAAIGKQAGLLAERSGRGGHYDMLRGRVTFPILDVRRRIVGFGGRALGDAQEPKYLNTPESPVFRKRETFYGFPWALEAIRRSGRAIVCEGYFDRIALQRAGLGEGVATCGTALTREHALALKRRTANVVMLFDGDEAGQKAMERALEALLPEGLRLRAAVLPPGMDPDDLLEQQGPEALRELVEGAEPALERVMRRAADRGRRHPEQQSEAVRHVAPLVALVPDSVERRATVARLALWMDSEAEDVQRAVADAAPRRAVARRADGTRSAAPGPADAAFAGAPAPAPGEASGAAPRRHGPEERQLMQLADLLLRHPTLGVGRRAALEPLLPEGEGRVLVCALLEACERGEVDADGELDHFRVAQGLEGGARKLLLEVVSSDGDFSRDAPPELVLGDIERWFADQQLKLRSRETTRMLKLSPDADDRALLAEKQRQLEARRARHQSARAPGAAR